MEKATHIIEDTANAFWAVWPTNDPDLAHVFYGVQVKRSGGSFVPKAKARTTLVRKEYTRVVTLLSTDAKFDALRAALA